MMFERPTVSLGFKGRKFSLSDPDTERGIKSTRKPGKYFRILAIDGGGVRGIIPTIVLQYIEKRTGYKIHELFNLVSGTSTGGLLGVMLSIPDDKDKLKPKFDSNVALDLYKRECPKIFPSSLYRCITSLWGMAGARYHSKNKRDIISRYVGEVKLSECLTDVLIPSFDVREGRPYFFKSSLAREDSRCDYNLLDVLDATSAAPTYFKPVQVTGYDAKISLRYRSFVDGALTANSPSLCAVVEALKVYKEEKSDILVVSLGCGTAEIGVAHTHASRWGGLKWAPYFPNALINGSMYTVGYQADQLLDDTNYWRFQAELPPEHSSIDDASKRNLAWLQRAGELLVLQNKDRLDLLCDMLLEGMP